MNTTPNANRKHIGIYGNTNSGKSSLMNKILGQDISLVSNVEGTTTDPVQKAMELIPFGPVLLIDTAGLEDKSQLGEIRVKKSFEYLKRLDFAIYVVDGKNLDVDTYKKWKREANKYNIKHMVVVNKLDRLSDDERSNINNIFDKPLFISAKNNENIDKLKDELIKSLEQDEAASVCLCTFFGSQSTEPRGELSTSDASLPAAAGDIGFYGMRQS